MSDSTTIARPYAAAVFEVANKTNQIELWSKFLSFGGALLQDKNLVTLVNNPSVVPAEMTRLILGLIEPVSFAQGENFLRLLIEKDRLTVLPEISVIFELLKAEAGKAQKVDVISAYPLSEDAKTRLAQSLAQKLNCKVTIESHVDPSLIGGAVIRAGDKVIDGSVRGRLQQMTTQLQV
jgi:F-type H+-transporting ATPase subunit delta